MEVSSVSLKLFDDFYFVGHQNDGFYILKTDVGLVIFDSFNVPNEKLLMQGLRELDLEREAIHTVFISQDCFENITEIQQIWMHTGCDVAIDAETTASMAHSVENWYQHSLIPMIPRFVKDGDHLTFGRHHIHATRTDSPVSGYLNYAIPVHHHGREHQIMMRCGCDAGSTIDLSDITIDSWEYQNDYPLDIKTAFSH